MKKPKADIIPGKTQAPLVGDVAYDPGEAPPVRSSKPEVQNTPQHRPAGEHADERYDGNVGDNPKQSSKGGV